MTAYLRWIRTAGLLVATTVKPACLWAFMLLVLFQLSHADVHAASRKSEWDASPHASTRLAGSVFSFFGLPAPDPNARPDLTRGNAAAAATMHGVSASGMLPAGYDPVSGQNFLYIDPGARVAGRSGDTRFNPTDIAVQRGLSAGSTFLNSMGENLVEGIGLPGKVSFNYRMDMDGRMSGDGDALLSVYETDFTTLFVQAGVRSMWDDRWIGNIGLGHRMIFTDKLMLGYNLFYDYDLGRDHERGGIGAEIWYDFFRVSGNYYAPISDWKESKDLDWHKERPAEGWDARVKGYLPFYRNVALTGAYSQWYGDKVGVFGSSKLEKDPRVWSYGMEYTPIPLVSAFVNQKQTEKNHTDTEVGLTLTYHFQMPWEDQVRPSKVAELRTVAGARHDFVDRENKIILEYKEKGLRAAFGQFRWDDRTIHMPLTIRSGSPITSVQWQGTAAQYLTTQSSSHGVVTIPDNGIYSIEAIVFNASGQRASTGVRYLYLSGTHHLQLISTQTTTMVKVPLTLTYRLTDSAGNALYGKTVGFGIPGNASQLSHSSAETGRDGTVSVVLTPDSAGTIPVDAECEGVHSLVEVDVVALRSGLIPASNRIKENAATELVFSLIGSDGVPKAGEPVTWRVVSGSSYAELLPSSESRTDASGKARATLRGTVGNVGDLETVKVEVKPGQGDAATANVQVKRLNYGLSVDPGQVIATIPYPYQLILTDDGVPVPNQTLDLIATSANLNFERNNQQTDASGRISMEVSAPQGPRGLPYDAEIKGVVYPNRIATTQLSVAPIEKDAILIPDAASVGQSEPVAVNLLAVRQLTGQPVTNAKVEWDVTGGVLENGSSYTDGSGAAKATVRSDTPGTIQVEAEVTAVTGERTTTATSVQVKGYALSLAAADSEIKEFATTTLTARLTRSDGVVVPGETVTWSISGSAASLSAKTTTTSGSGETTVNLVGKGEGTVTITASTPLTSPQTVQVRLTGVTYTLSADPALLVKYIEQPVTFRLLENGQPAAFQETDISLSGIGAVSGMPSRVTTDEMGRFRPDLTGEGEGEVTVRALINGKTATTSLTVAEANATATLIPSVVQVASGDTVEFVFTAQRKLRSETQPIANHQIYWHIDEGAGTIVSSSRMTDGLGHGTAVVRTDAPGRLVMHAELVENRSVAATAEVLALGDGYTLTFSRDSYSGSFSGSKAEVKDVVLTLKDAANRPVKDARLRFSATVDDSANEGIHPNRRGKFYGFTVSKTGGQTITGGATYPSDAAITDANGQVTLRFTDVLGERTIRLQASYDVSSTVTVVDTAYVKFGKGPIAGFRFPKGPEKWVVAADDCGGYGYLNPHKHEWTEEHFGAPLPQYVNNSNLPRAEDLLAFMKNNKEAMTAAGWPTNYSYWTGTARRRTDNALIVSPTNPRDEDISGPSNWLYWTCIRK